MEGMDTCDPNSGKTHGASLPGKCIQYVSLPARVSLGRISDIW
jgi:hypothetical protein